MWFKLTLKLNRRTHDAIIPLIDFHIELVASIKTRGTGFIQYRFGFASSSSDLFYCCIYISLVWFKTCFLLWFPLVLLSSRGIENLQSRFDTRFNSATNQSYIYSLFILQVLHSSNNMQIMTKWVWHCNSGYFMAFMYCIGKVVYKAVTRCRDR